MSYCVKDDLLGQISLDQLIQLTDDNSTHVENSELITQAIADADGEIDGWVGKRISVPLSPVPDIVRKMSTDIAIYNLFARRQGAPEDRKDRYKNAITFLRSVAEGKATLGADSPGGTPQATPVVITSQTRIFSRTTMEEF